MVPTQIHRTALAEGEGYIRLGETRTHRTDQCLPIFFGPCEHRRLALIEYKTADGIKIDFVEPRVSRRGIEHDEHAAGRGAGHDIGQFADFVLQQQPIALPIPVKHLIDEITVDGTVRAGVQHNAVVAAGIVLDDGVAAAHIIAHYHRGHAHRAGFEQVAQEHAVPSYLAGMVHIGAGTSQCDRLIQSLASGEHVERMRGDGLAFGRKMIHPVHIVDVQRAEIQYAHQDSFPMTGPVTASS